MPTEEELQAYEKRALELAVELAKQNGEENPTIDDIKVFDKGVDSDGDKVWFVIDFQLIHVPYQLYVSIMTDIGMVRLELLADYEKKV